MKEIKFVDVGEGITEGHIQKWLVKDGDSVKEDQSILQVETDKAVVNVPAPIDGIVKIVAKENTTVKLGGTIAYVGTKEELANAGTSATTAAPKTPSTAVQGTKIETQKATGTKAQDQKVPAQSEKEILATPFVRKLAKDLNIDISKVSGSGPNGKILEGDIRSFNSNNASPAASKTTESKTAPKFSEKLEETHKGQIERLPMSQTRKAIARNMENSWTIPRAVHMDLINATNLFNLVSKEKPKLEKEKSLHLTILPFIIKAAVAALKENPNFNASYDKEALEIIRKNYYNIGLAAEAPDGLKVVVIKEADKKSTMELAKEIQELSAKVKNQTITLQEMQDSTFTITNIGSLGGGFLSVPMINYPDVAILGIHLIREMPIVENGAIKIGRVLPFSLVFDHRVVDGAEAVKFGNVLIKYLEDPDLLEMI